MKGKPVLPPGLFDKSELYSKRSWKRVRYMCDLWKIWTNEYLPLLQDRQKWNRKGETLFSFIAKCVCTHKGLVLVLGASSTEWTNI